MKYAREVPFMQYDWQHGKYSTEDITDTPGMFNMRKAIELEIIKDGEGNPIHPIFDTDESGDTPEHCGDCHEMIDVSWTGEAVSYAVEALKTYIINTLEGKRTFNAELLDEWNDHLSWHIGLSGLEENIREVYANVRERQMEDEVA